MVVNIINMSIPTHFMCLGQWNWKHCFVFLLSYSQDQLVTGAISSAVYNHPSLKELTIGDKRSPLTTGGRCHPSLDNGAVGGIVRKAGVKKLVVRGNVFPGEL